MSSSEFSALLPKTVEIDDTNSKKNVYGAPRTSNSKKNVYGAPRTSIWNVDQAKLRYGDVITILQSFNISIIAVLNED